MPLTIQCAGELTALTSVPLPKVTTVQPLFNVYLLLIMLNFVCDPHPAGLRGDISPIDRS